MEIDETPPPKKRCVISKNELQDLTKDELIDKYLLLLEQNGREPTSSELHDNSEYIGLKESEEKLKQQQIDATRRENNLVMRLTTKEQEIQEYMGQIQELKQSQMPSVSQLRSSLTDPAVNLLFEGLKKELELTKAKLEETQNELSAWKFTPDSNTGKRLMAKCRLLYQENEELGKMISSGKMAKLESDLALQKNLSEEMKKSEAEQYEYLVEVEEEVEGMQSTIVLLQKQLHETKEQLDLRKKENEQLQFSLTSTSKENESNLIRTNVDPETKNSSNINQTHPPGPKEEGVDAEPETATEEETAIANSSNLLQNGDHDSEKDSEAEPMDTSNVNNGKSDLDSLESSDRTKNGEDNSEEFRTKKANPNFDSDTEVQVAQTLAAWANCDTNVSLKSKTPDIVENKDIVA